MKIMSLPQIQKYVFFITYFVFLKSPCNKNETGLLIWILGGGGGWGGTGPKGGKGKGQGRNNQNFLDGHLCIHHLQYSIVRNNSEVTHLKCCYIKMVKFPENLT
jgi:hypothetical protein